MCSRFKVLLVSTSVVAESGAQPQAGARQKPQQEEGMLLHAGGSDTPESFGNCPKGLQEKVKGESH